MLPRRSKRIKLDSSSTTASKPKVAKVAPKSKIKVAPKAKKAKVDRKPKKSKVETELKQTNEDLKLSEQKPKQEVRNGRGALRDLPEMPLDIICEVIPNFPSAESYRLTPAFYTRYSIVYARWIFFVSLVSIRPFEIY